MEIEKDAQTMVSALDYFCLPAALVDPTTDKFVSWNQSFLDGIEASRDELKMLGVEKLVSFSWNPANEKTGVADSNLPIYMGGCTVKAVAANRVEIGRAFKREDHFVLLILDSRARSLATADFLEGLALGKEQENERIKRRFHDFVNHHILLVSFEANSLTKKLRDEGVSGDPELSRLTKMLDDLMDAIPAALAG